MPVSPLFWFLFGYPLVLLRPAPIPNHSLPPPILPCPLPLAFLLTPSFFLSQTLSVLLSFLPYPLSLGISRHYLGLGSYFPYPLGHYSEKLFLRNSFPCLLPSLFGIFRYFFGMVPFWGHYSEKFFLPTSFHFSFLFSPSQVSLGILGDSLPFHVSYHVSLSSSLRSCSLSGRFGLLWGFSGPFGGFWNLLGAFSEFSSPLLFLSSSFFPFCSLIIPFYSLSIPYHFSTSLLLGWFWYSRGLLGMISPRHYSDRLFHYSDPLFTIPTSLGHYSEKLFFTYHYSLSVPILPLSPPSPCSLAIPWAFGAFQAFFGLFLPFSLLCPGLLL